MKIVRGRSFDDVEPDRVLLINESLAWRDYTGVDPIGKRIRLPWFGQDGYGTIVGVVEDLKYARIDVDATPEVFFAVAQTNILGVMLALGIDGDALAAAPMIRKALAAVDPTQSIFAVRTMEQSLAESIAPRRFNLLLLGTFAFGRRLSSDAGRLPRRRARGGRTFTRNRHPTRPRAEQRRVVGMIVGECIRRVPSA